MLLSVICAPAHAAAFEEILFRETGTFGVRARRRARQTPARGGHGRNPVGAGGREARLARRVRDRHPRVRRLRPRRAASTMFPCATVYAAVVKR